MSEDSGSHIAFMLKNWIRKNIDRKTSYPVFYEMTERRYDAFLSWAKSVGAPHMVHRETQERGVQNMCFGGVVVCKRK